MISVDGFDLKILAALQDDGRLTNQQLADIAGLSASQCSRRRMRLEEDEVIAGYHADDIQEAYSLTGDADYLLKAVLRDLKSLSDIVNNVLMPHQSVAHVRSSIVLDRLKESSKLPLKELAR